MSYELTELLNRCNKEDASFLAAIIDSYVNFSDDKGLRNELASWKEGPMPLSLNHKLETEIRYAGSNDFAYAVRKARGIRPAGVSIDEIIDDLCKLLKIRVPRTGTLESRLEIFSANVVEREFRGLSDERKRELINGMNFSAAQRNELIDKVINNRELLIPVVLSLVGQKAAPEVLQGFLIAVLAPFIGVEAARQLLVQIATRIPVFGALLGPIIMAAGTGWLIADLAGPASRKTIPLLLYLGILCFRDGEAEEFIAEEGGRLPPAS